MKFKRLFDVIGEQPLFITEEKDVVAVIERNGKTEAIPLKLKVQLNSDQKLWFTEDKK